VLPKMRLGVGARPKLLPIFCAMCTLLSHQDILA